MAKTTTGEVVGLSSVSELLGPPDVEGMGGRGESENVVVCLRVEGVELPDSYDGEKDRKKIEELKRLLAEEKRASKEAVAKLHRELYRQRQTSPANSATADVQARLLRELDRERMMRLGTQQRLQDVQVESDSCRARLHALQEEFRKMEEMVANMLQYKAKIDQLKQENASMKTSYESNLQKYCSHISSLERDNMMLRNQVKSMETQIHGKGDERDKSKLLLERLKMVEAENSSLVLENEQQRQQYEKCLDQIANQVVQALLAQKTLREECLKLQTRVQDLELQNKHLNAMFQKRLRGPAPELGVGMATDRSPGPVSNRGSMSLEFLNTAGSLQSMCSEIIGDDSPGKAQLSSPPPWLKGKSVADADGATSTSTHSSPSSPSSTSSSSSPSSTPSVPIPISSISRGRQPRPKEKDNKGKGKGANSTDVRIETEFPAAGNTSPKVKRVAVFERRARSLERNATNRITSNWYSASPSAIVAAMAGGKGPKGANRSRRGSESNEKSYFPPSRLKQSTSADAISHFGVNKKLTPSQSQILSQVARWKNLSSSQDRLEPQTLLRSLSKDEGPAVFLAGKDFDHQSFEAFNKNFEKLLAKNSNDEPEDPIWVSGSPRLQDGSSPALPTTSVTSVPKCMSTSSPPSFTSHPSTTSTSKQQQSKRKQEQVSKMQASSAPKENQTTSKSTQSSVSAKLPPPTSSSTKASTSSLTPKAQTSKHHVQQQQPKIPGPSQSFLDESARQQSKKSSNRSHYAAPLRDPFASQPDPSRKPSSSSSSHPYYYYYDYSDEDSDSRSRPISRDFSSASTMSLNEILDSSMEGEIALDDDFFSDWSSIRLTPGKRSGDHLTGAAISNKALEAGNKTRAESSSSSARSRSTSSSPEMCLPGALKNANAAARNLAATSVLALREARLKQAVLAATKCNNGIPMTRAEVPTTSMSGLYTTTGQPVFFSSSNTSAHRFSLDQDTVHSPIVSRNISQQARTRILESSSSPKFPHNNVIKTRVVADVHSEAIPSDNVDFNLPSASPSPNLSQRSQDQGYASKESHSQSSPSPSPSISHRGTVTPPWLHSTKDPHSFTRNELLSLVINREALGAGQKTSIPSSSTPGRASPTISPKLRPGQLILAPQDKSFNFSLGFSSASSGSSDDKSPTKMFSSSRQDMESSVIEVKQDGSHIYPSGLQHSASSSTASSITTSSCSSSVASSATSSPVKSPSGSKVPPPVPKKPTRAVKPEARVPPSNTKSSETNGLGNNNNNDATPSRNAAKDSTTDDSNPQSDHKKPTNTNITVGFLLQEQVFPPSLVSKTDVVEDFLMQALKGKTPHQTNNLNMHISPGLTSQHNKHTTKLQTPSGSSNSSPYQTKCQSSDSSFENLRVERSGSKDDGYSTMSSDIHPEILDKFADDLPSSHNTTGSTSFEASDVFQENDITTDDSSTGEGTLVLVKDSNINKSRSPSKQSEKNKSMCIASRPQAEVKQSNSSNTVKRDAIEKTFQSLSSSQKESCEKSITSNFYTEKNIKTSLKDTDYSKDPAASVNLNQSLDVTSDADSALETSAHSTDTTVTVSDIPPCHSHETSLPSASQSSIGNNNRNIDTRNPKPGNSRVGVSKLTKIFDAKSKSVPNSPPTSKGSIKTKPHRANTKRDGKTLNHTPAHSSSTKPVSQVVEPSSTCASRQTNSTAPSSKQHDSPKRLANQFLKKAATGVTKTCKRITSPASASIATVCPPTKQPSQPNKNLQKSTDASTISSKPKNPTEDTKNLNKTSSPNSTSENRLRFGFSGYTKPKTGKEKAWPARKTNTPLPPSPLPAQQGVKKTSASTGKSKLGLKFLNTSVHKSASAKQNVQTIEKPSTLENTPHSIDSSGVGSTNTKAAKPPRPLSADYATSISNINEVPHHSGDSSGARMKTCQKQRPFSVCSDRDVGKNSPLRIIMTNQAFQQQSSSDSDTDSEEKLKTFSFSKISKTHNYNFYDDFPNKNSTDVNEENIKDPILMPSGSTNVSTESESCSETPFLSTTKSESCSIHTHRSTICSSTSLLQSSVNSMQTCQHSQPNASATRSSIEISQQVQNQPSNSSIAISCQNQPTSTPPSTPTEERLNTSTSRPAVIRKSKSEHSLSMKPAATSAFDAFFGSVWDSGKMLERSASVSELDLLSKRSGSLCDIDDLDDSCDGWDRPSSSEFDADTMVSSWPPPKQRSFSSNSGFLASQAQGFEHDSQGSNAKKGTTQFVFQRYHFYKSHHQHHSQRRHISHPHPLHLQPLRLDLSDVTELDEDGSERGDTGSSFRGSLDTSGRLTDEESSKLTGDESPRLDVDGQATRFNSQFYSLCKVDSNRSLQSSVNNSRERLSLTNLNESCEGDGLREDEMGGGKYLQGNNDENVIAAKEFDEISRQIASLSKTVDEINNSLSSLTSSEFDPDTACTNTKRAFRMGDELLFDSVTAASLASSLPKLAGRRRNDIIDGYHWVNDEFLLISGSGEIIAGGCRDNDGEDNEDDNSSNDVYACPPDFTSSSEHIDTEDAREEFFHISTISTKTLDSVNVDHPLSENWTLSKTCFGGQDDIFASSNFDTVRENISLSDGVARQKRKESKAHVNKGHKDLQNVVNIHKQTQEPPPRTDTDDKSPSIPEYEIHEVSNSAGIENRRLESDAEDVCAGPLGTSHLDSDDSLASDIGLDHMMCQRLFGQKGEGLTSSKVSSEGSFVGSRGNSPKKRDMSFTFLDNISYDNPSSVVDVFDFVHLDQDLGKENTRDVIALSNRMCLDGNNSFERRQGVTHRKANNYVEILVEEGQIKVTETRDVGVDAMTHSQFSLSASFEYFDHSPLAENGFNNDVSTLIDTQSESGCLDLDQPHNESLESDGSSEQDPCEPENCKTTTNHPNSSSNHHQQQELRSPSNNMDQSNANENSVASMSDSFTDLEASSRGDNLAGHLKANNNIYYDSLEAHPRRKAGEEPRNSEEQQCDAGIIARPEDKRANLETSRQTYLVPRLPPRRPIITNGTLHASLERGIPPPPSFLSSPQHSRSVGENSAIYQMNMMQPFPHGSPASSRHDRQRLFFRQQHSFPQDFYNYDNSRAHRHVPYVNQPIPPLTFSPFCPVASERSMGSYIPRPLSDTFAPHLVNPIHCKRSQLQNDQQSRHSVKANEVTSGDSLSPPPLPPRQPHISRTLDGRPQVHIRPHRIQSDPRPPRPHSFNHYIIDKSKAVSSSSSSTSSSSPTSSSLTVRPRSHSETHFNFPVQDKHQPTVTCGEPFHAGPQKRRLKTRRERSQIKQGKTSRSTDNTVVNPESSYPTTKSNLNPSHSSSKVKSASKDTIQSAEEIHSSQNTDKSSNGTSVDGAQSVKTSVCRRPWKDTITSANVCVSGSESSCEDSSGSVN